MASSLDDTDSPVTVLRIPDTLASWPWLRAINPHYEDCKRESSAWAEGFHAFGPKAQAAFNKCDFNLLAALAYAGLDRAGCRVACDMTNLFFIFDEWSDVSTAPETRVQADIIMDALRNPHKPRPSDEWVGGEVARQFWQNAIQTATQSAQTRFIDTFEQYTDSVVQQSLDRSKGSLRDMNDYFKIRRETIGLKPSLMINQINFDIPDHVHQNPIITRLTNLSTDMILIANDIYSYNVEQSRGDDNHNLVTVVMAELDLGIQDALDWIGRFHDKLANEFLEEFAHVPSFATESEPVQHEIRLYVDAIGNWVRANDQWSFESQRYFGSSGLHVLKERTVTLLPKRDAPPLGPLE